MALILVLALVISIGGGLLLYALVRGEHANRQVVDRQTGERIARRDTPEESDATQRSAPSSNSDRTDRQF